MGRAELSPAKIPGALPGDAVVARAVDIGGETYEITCVSMGNPHAVVFVAEPDNLDLEKLGPLFETNPIFPDRVNTEFVKIIDAHNVKMRVWERGSGETLACGTGMCAAAVAAVLGGYCPKGEDIKVVAPGGELVINYTDERVYMTGNCVKVFDGVIEV
jgi:carbamoyl-phosphate synthase large subunit